MSLVQRLPSWSLPLQGHVFSFYVTENIEAFNDFVFSIKYLVVIYENIDMNIQYFNLTDLVRLFLQ